MQMKLSKIKKLCNRDDKNPKCYTDKANQNKEAKKTSCQNHTGEAKQNKGAMEQRQDPKTK